MNNQMMDRYEVGSGSTGVICYRSTKAEAISIAADEAKRNKEQVSVYDRLARKRQKQNLWFVFPDGYIQGDTIQESSL